MSRTNERTNEQPKQEEVEEPVGSTVTECFDGVAHCDLCACVRVIQYPLPFVPCHEFLVVPGGT